MNCHLLFRKSTKNNHAGDKVTCDEIYLNHLPYDGKRKKPSPCNEFFLRNRYDAFCKAVLRNEAKNYLSEMARQRDREKSLDALTQQEMDLISWL